MQTTKVTVKDEILGFDEKTSFTIKCAQYPTSCIKVQSKAAEITEWVGRDKWLKAIADSCWVCPISPSNYELETPI